MKTHHKSGIKIEELTYEHEKGAIQLFVESFCDSEPITKHLNISYDEYIPFATDVVQKAIKDGFSIVILDTDERVVGLIVAEDLADPFIPDLVRYPKLKPICGLLEELSKPFKQNKKFIKGKVLHTWVAAVDPTFRSQGLYTEVGLKHVSLAQEKGFEFIYSDFTSNVSEKIVKNFPVTLCNTLVYDSYVYCYKPFEGVKGNATSYITPLKPDIQLENLEKCYTLTNSDES